MNEADNQDQAAEDAFKAMVKNLVIYAKLKGITYTQTMTYFETMFSEAGDFERADTVGKVREKWTDIPMERGEEQPGD
jgi:hypothetical protein